MPGGVEAGGEFEAAPKQGFRIGEPADPGGDLGQHADGGDVGGKPLEEALERTLGDRQPVVDQRDRGLDQDRIGDGGLDLLRVIAIGGGPVAECCRQVAQRAPGVAHLRLEFGCPPQGGLRVPRKAKRG